MKKIAIAGYHFTGCGVIDDLFREFDNVAQTTSEFESRFLQDMDGVSDLEYHLVENPHRLKTSLAIDRFLRYCKRGEKGFSHIYGPDWYTMCEEYINSIIKFRYQGYNLRHLDERSPYYGLFTRLMMHLQKFKPPKIRKSPRHNYFPNEKLYHALPSEEEFLEKTRSFTEHLFNCMITNKKAEYVMIDQMFAGNNPDRYFRYVIDVKGFVVDRDPRDIYIGHQLRKDFSLPKDPLQFCIHFRDIRKPLGKTNPNVMYLMIEDMIYHYDEIVPKVCEFVGIERAHHVEPKKYFNPDISIKGTRMWEHYPQFSDAVNIIEQELSEFLYKNY